MKTSTILLFFIAVVISLNLSARDFFVAPNGNDQNPGTKIQPLQSLAGARDLIRQLKSIGKLNEEVRVIVANGMYFMSEPLLLTEQDSGSEQYPVIYKAEDGANPVFIGGLAVKNWEKIDGNVWKTKVSEVSRMGFYFEQLYVNGKYAIRAQAPNHGFYFLKDVNETVVSKGNSKVPDMAVQTLKVFPEAATYFAKFLPTDFDDAVLTLYHKWDNTRKRVLGYNADSLSVFIAGKGMKPWNSLDKKTRFKIENFKAALDTVNEWYLERNGDLYYIPSDNENPNQLRIYAPVTEQLVVLRGDGESVRMVKNIRFENLRFEVTGYRMPLWGNEPAQAASPVGAAIMADFAVNIAFVNCEISQIGTNAIWLRKACSNCDIQHCYIHDLGAGGIKIGDIRIPENKTDLTNHIRVDNNIIRGGGSVFPCAVGVTIFQASDNSVTHNEIADFRYSGISVGWVWGYDYSPTKRNTIEFNHIHHLGWGELCDMGGVYCLGQSEGTSVSNNVIHHVYSFDYGGWGLYTDEGSTGILMENNLVYACKNSGFHQHYGKENTIRNNIFAANIKGQLQATRVEDHLSFSFTNNIVWFNSGSLFVSRWNQVKINSDKNCYWDTRTKDVSFDKLSFKEWQASGHDRNSVIANPEFSNPETFDFRIKNKALLRKIGFQAFDYSRAGVYGTPEWKELAVFDPALSRKYDEKIQKLAGN